MVEVNLWSGLRRFTDGEIVVSVEATTVGELLDALVKAHPGLAPVIEAGVSVAVDGEIITGRQNPVPADAEVYLMQRLKGG
ncbi:MoaD/ThiS family protein [Ostreiculturibacter nitratireducens]|uniref:MoaD/ThiS family protein n=1 Tax=Ostreiculturibacter nitratireducens TaxID=3075226 RepID=UPI0031B5D987